MRIGDYYIEEKLAGQLKLLNIYKDDYVWARGDLAGQRRAVLVVHVFQGKISYIQSRMLDDPDLAEILGLALDRAATILREAREDADADRIRS